MDQRDSTPILLIDGHANDAERITRALQKDDVQAVVHFAPDGQDAIEFLLRSEKHAHAPRPVLILLDLSSKERGGYEFLTMIKSDKSLLRIPVILLASAADANIHKAYGLRANCCVQKPQTPEEITDFISFVKTFWLDLMSLPN